MTEKNPYRYPDKTEARVWPSHVEERTSSMAFATLMRNVYVWMTLALSVTALTALYVSRDYTVQQALYSSSILFYGALIAEIALVWIVSARIDKMKFSTAGILFVLYSVLNGLTLSFIFLLYTSGTIAAAFFTTAGTFAAMSLAGFFIKRDLSALGRILFMMLIGLIIATIVNVFWGNSTLFWICNYVGVILFTALTAYDTQKIKQMLQTHGTETNEGTMKLALLGSLSLYLDFVNLFLYILRIFGNRD